MPTPQPVIRLLSGLLLLCSAASARAALDPSPWQLDFQEHALFTTSAPMATTLSNTGNQSLTVVDVSPATGVYARAGGSCGAVPFTIAAQASCTIEHTFTPDALAVFYQTITTTLASGDHVAFGLAGEGAQGHLTIDPLFGLDWSSTPVGAIGVEKIAILANDGPVPMQITEIVTSSVPAVSAFVRTGGNCPEPPINFGDGGSCTLAYTFVPAQVGESTTDLDFRGGGSAYSLSLSGEGSPEIPLFEDGFEATAPAPMQ
ncbi:MAG: choice-of-anchor D domain-containing protein [Dokdonella sp.]